MGATYTYPGNAWVWGCKHISTDRIGAAGQRNLGCVAEAVIYMTGWYPSLVIEDRPDRNRGGHTGKQCRGEGVRWDVVTPDLGFIDGGKFAGSLCEQPGAVAG